jgi:hypothetical protein
MQRSNWAIVFNNLKSQFAKLFIFRIMKLAIIVQLTMQVYCAELPLVPRQPRGGI